MRELQVAAVMSGPCSVWTKESGNLTHGSRLEQGTPVHLELYREFETGSLRQLIRAEHSPPACERKEIPNKHGPSRANLRTATYRPGPEIRSLRPFFSKPPDCADLVRIFKLLI
jgi:hypothetical protein